MHCVQLADLAAVLSHHGPAILYRREAVPTESVTSYWTSSRSRLELWHRAIGRYHDAELAGDWIGMRQWWRDHVGVLEEVLVSELLTRVVAALAAGLEYGRDEEEISPITHAIYLAHLESRNRVQQLMLFGRGNTVENAVRLNRLRKAVERWNDALLGRLWANIPAELCYAIDRERALSYASDARDLGSHQARETADWLTQAAMHDTLSRRTTPQSSLPQANQNVCDSVMLMLRPDLFDSVGVLKSIWMHRMEFDCERTSRVVDELLSPPDSAQGTELGPGIQTPMFDRW